MKFTKYIIIIVFALGIFGCNDYLNLEPTDKISADKLFASADGINAFMANLYSNAPIEDFNCVATNGMSWNPPWPNNAGFYPWIMTDEAVGSQHQVIVGWGGLDFHWWEEGYKLNKDLNFFLEIIPDLKISEEIKTQLKGEALFLRAYTYYALAKRYGGVPIITEIASVDDSVTMYTPRSTEKETWDFTLQTCDEAIALLNEGDGSRKRATKWAALALKSRAALHAASVAKYWNRAPLSGEAVDKKLVGGMDESDAQRYYTECISASEELIKSGEFTLYKASPATVEEASENYRELFEDPNRALNEVIFMKDFPLPGDELGSNQDNWGNPNQTRGTWPHPGRFNPSLELVDLYEDYSNPGQSAPIVTTEDGDIDNYDGYNKNRTYLEFDSPTDIFKGKDARLSATVILPGSIWKDTKIIIQGGYIKPNGTPVMLKSDHITVDGETYYTYGASDLPFYSGFNPLGYSCTRSGFGFKKFLDSKFVPTEYMNQSTTGWIDFRLAEIFLNYAEAVVESGQGDATLAEQGLNAIRKRAAHKTNIPLTLENVLRERRVEMAFENVRYWDLERRREYHTLFHNTIRHALIPVFDLRTKKYIFIRSLVPWAIPNSFFERYYYKIIPGIGSNGLIQNPQY